MNCTGRIQDVLAMCVLRREPPAARWLRASSTGKLRKVLDPYLKVALRFGRTSANGRIASRAAAAPSRADRDQNQAIRQWATKNGYEVSERGRIPASIV